MCFGGEMLSCQLYLQFELSPIDKKNAGIFVESCLFVQTAKGARERFWPVVEHQVLNLSIHSLSQPISLEMATTLLKLSFPLLIKTKLTSKSIGLYTVTKASMSACDNFISFLSASDNS
ncbi:hypothetical protein PoB_002900500 [Plakobranchus ocellatus]|uniref:Uncharacterized protein n=1 Tax=Plakobranchus ocellatus TaxID=259542 RepID=A0AAV4A319_9GAST|nr:hypothetical protein PoB_002900500 [Plakobranchus ocellatus]